MFTKNDLDDILDTLLYIFESHDDDDDLKELIKKVQFHLDHFE